MKTPKNLTKCYTPIVNFESLNSAPTYEDFLKDELRQWASKIRKELKNHGPYETVLLLKFMEGENNFLIAEISRDYTVKNPFGVYDVRVFAVLMLSPEGSDKKIGILDVEYSWWGNQYFLSDYPQKIDVVADRCLEELVLRLKRDMGEVIETVIQKYSDEMNYE